jgi:hypothetical protein
MVMVALQEQEEGIQHRQRFCRGQTRSTAKIHISLETAELLKIYCVLNRLKMVEFTTEVIEKELKEFRRQLEAMRKLKQSP